MPLLTCLLCGAEGPQVRVMLVRWKVPLPGREYEALPRCTDTRGCRERLVVIGEEWPLVEIEPSPASYTVDLWIEDEP